MKKLIIGLYVFLNALIFFYVILSSMNSRHQAITIMAMGFLNFCIVQYSDYLNSKKELKEEKEKI